jgi:hypothetical protein
MLISSLISPLYVMKSWVELLWASARPKASGDVPEQGAKGGAGQ